MPNHTFSYEVIRSVRKTIAVQIMPDGRILVRCPKRMSVREIESFLRQKSGWIEAHLQKQAAVPRFPALTREEIKTLSQQASQTLPRKVAFYADKIGVSYGRITIRSQRTRWGSCSSKGNLNFNCLLMLAPEAVLDYVVVHELCHRKELNHSRQFWAAVETILPDYRQCKTWLKENGAALISRLLE